MERSAIRAGNRVKWSFELCYFSMNNSNYCRTFPSHIANLLATEFLFVCSFSVHFLISSERMWCNFLLFLLLVMYLCNYWMHLSMSSPPPRYRRFQALGGDMNLEFWPRVGKFDLWFVLKAKSFYLHAWIRFCELSSPWEIWFPTRSNPYQISTFPVRGLTLIGASPRCPWHWFHYLLGTSSWHKCNNYIYIIVGKFHKLLGRNPAADVYGWHLELESGLDIFMSMQYTMH